MTSALDEVAARLYELPPEEFTAARTEAVATARKAGDKKLATQIGALRRPTVGAWLVNLLAHRRPDLIDELFTLGEHLRSAQRNLRGDELRQLSTERRRMVGALAREARALAVAAGRGTRAALPLDDVETTLTAALADDEVAEQVRLGRLVKTVEYAGFGESPRPQLRLVQGGASAPAAPSREERQEQREREKAAAEKEKRATAEKKAAAQREAAERAATERAAARERAAEQRRRQQAAHRELLAARTALAEAEAQRTAAEQAVRAARRRVEKALAEAEAARGDR